MRKTPRNYIETQKGFKFIGEIISGEFGYMNQHKSFNIHYELARGTLPQYQAQLKTGIPLDEKITDFLIKRIRGIEASRGLTPEQREEMINSICNILAESYQMKSDKNLIQPEDIIRISALEKKVERESYVAGIFSNIKDKYFESVSYFREKWKKAFRSDSTKLEKISIEEAERIVKEEREWNEETLKTNKLIEEKERGGLLNELEKLSLYSIEDRIY